MVAKKKGVECLSVRSGDCMYGSGCHTSALADFFKNPTGEVILELVDDEGIVGRVSIRIGDDDKLVLLLEIESFGRE